MVRVGWRANVNFVWRDGNDPEREDTKSTGYERRGGEGSSTQPGICMFRCRGCFVIADGKRPQTIWKYNALYHLHSNGGILPEIPGELLVKMFIHKKEEQALGIGK
jgi:hypothetical protein